VKSLLAILGIVSAMPAYAQMTFYQQPPLRSSDSVVNDVLRRAQTPGGQYETDLPVYQRPQVCRWNGYGYACR